MQSSRGWLTNCGPATSSAARGFKERLGQVEEEAAPLWETIMKTLQHRGPNLFMITSSTKATVPVEPCITHVIVEVVAMTLKTIPCYVELCINSKLCWMSVKLRGRHTAWMSPMTGDPSPTHHWWSHAMCVNINMYNTTKTHNMTCDSRMSYSTALVPNKMYTNICRYSLVWQQRQIGR